MNSKDLSTLYRILFCEKVKKDFLTQPFYDIWPVLSAEQKEEYGLSGWRLTAYESLRNLAQKMMLSNQRIGREEEATGCFFLASELLAHPEFSKDDFFETMNQNSSDFGCMFSEDVRKAVLSDLDIVEHVIRPTYVSKYLHSFEDSLENLRALILRSTAIDSHVLTPDQKAIESFSKEVFGLDTKFFTGLDELHGRYDSHTNSIYINADAPSDIDWTFWHVAFHSLRQIDPHLYDSIVDTTKDAHIFSREAIVKYRLSIKQPHMKDEAVIEEMLADAFADLKTNRRPIIKLAEKKTGVASRLMRFAKSAAYCIHDVMVTKDDRGYPFQDRDVYPKVALNDEQFAAFADQIDLLSHIVVAMDIPKDEVATGYRIVSADGRYLAAKLLVENVRVYDTELYSDFMMHKFDHAFVENVQASPKLMIKALEENSPLASTPGYAKSVISDVTKHNKDSVR